MFSATNKPIVKCPDCGGVNLSLECVVTQDEHGIDITSICDDGPYCQDCEANVRVEEIDYCEYVEERKL